MSAPVVAVLTFLSVLGAAFLGLFSKTRLPSERVQEDTNSLIRLVMNFFVVMTGLLLGLMLNSARNALETNNGNIRALATEIILLDRTMRALGPETEDAHRHLVEYVKAALSEWQGSFEVASPKEASLEAAGASLRAIRVPEEQKATWKYARDLYRRVIRQRWVLVKALGRTIPTPLIIMLIVLVVFIFAGFGYAAPRTVVMTLFFLAALLTSAALFLIVDTDTPTTGLFEPIQVSNAPFQRAFSRVGRMALSPPPDQWLPGFNFNVEEWFEGDQYETLAICRSLALARAAFKVAIAEKPAARFMIR
jgi:hypothetical protein